ncbi:hypothetical protein FHR92_004956 [Fontibacillus solani]|uniref:Uncharacterized protein n=1 Tax=Fontibacillus solani TaxID=1572857 RepID=A0A7W3XU44_9BACL|nr:hypothetical protein [Fontibacillus solani]
MNFLTTRVYFGQGTMKNRCSELSYICNGIHCPAVFIAEQP